MMKKTLALGAALGAVALGAMAYYGNNKIDVTEHSYSKEDFGENLDGLRMVHLSDLQMKSFGQGNKKLASKVKSLRPDLIFFTGDALDRRYESFDNAIALMEKLVDIAPVFFVDGNHERAFVIDDETKQSMLEIFHEELKKLGVRILSNSSEAVKVRNGKIRIMGLDEKEVMIPGKNRLKKREDVDLGSLEETIRSIKSQGDDCDLTVFLAHEPQFIKEYSTSDADFVFSGHAHGGQVRIPFIGGIFAPGQGFLPQMSEGVIVHGRSIMMVSRGLGNSSFPVRVFNCPEIILAVIE